MYPFYLSFLTTSEGILSKMFITVEMNVTTSKVSHKWHYDSKHGAFCMKRVNLPLFWIVKLIELYHGVRYNCIRI